RANRASRTCRASVALRSLRTGWSLCTGVAGYTSRTCGTSRTGVAVRSLRTGRTDRALSTSRPRGAGRTGISPWSLRTSCTGIALRSLNTGRASGAGRARRTGGTGLIPVQRFLRATTDLTECGVDDPQRTAGRVATVDDARDVGNARVRDTTE